MPIIQEGGQGGGGTLHLFIGLSSFPLLITRG